MTTPSGPPPYPQFYDTLAALGRQITTAELPKIAPLLDRIAAALERIAAAQEIGHPTPKPK